jgi:hypothetical protein
MCFCSISNSKTQEISKRAQHTIVSGHIRPELYIRSSSIIKFGLPKIGDVAPESDILGKCMFGLPLTISTNYFLPTKKESNIRANYYSLTFVQYFTLILAFISECEIPIYCGSALFLRLKIH